MFSQYDHVWRVLNGYSGIEDKEVDHWEEQKRKRREEEKTWTRYFFRRHFPDCKDCNPPVRPGLVRLDRGEILSRVDMLDLVARYAPPPKRSGTVWRTLCMFHNERNPSLNIWPDSKRYWCPSCDAKGTCFDLAMHMEGVDFIGAMHLLTNLYP